MLHRPAANKIKNSKNFRPQYQRYVNVLKSFIRAEGTGNWSLHLQYMSNMIKLFAATNHINYAKCARLNPEIMLQLETEHP